MKEEILIAIEANLDKHIFDLMKKSIEDSEADRGIYETWGGRPIQTYNAVKDIYKIVINEP